MATTRVAKFKKTHNTPTILVGCNDDLLIEILSRLPAKSILRFKSVSKHWLSLLSNPHFTLRFDKLLVSPGFFFNDDYNPLTMLKTKAVSLFRVLNSILIHGLLLCCSNCGSAPTRKYYVFNPATKQFQIIPPLVKVHDRHVNVTSMGLAFHQTDCVHYKLVCIYRDPNPDRPSYKIQIYSSDTRKWRILNESFPLSIHLPFCKYVVYWNGSLHWASIDNPFYLKLYGEHLHNLSLQNLQTSTPSYCIPLYFGESRGHLHLVEPAYHESPLHLNVYEMLIDHSGWFLKYQVNLHELVKAYPKIIYNYPNQSIPPSLSP